MEKKYKYRTRQKRTEHDVQKVLCKYTMLKYPFARQVNSISGVNLSKTQRGKLKELRQYKGDPDWYLQYRTNLFTTLALELKLEGTNIFKKNGELKTDHLKRQLSFIMYQRSQGYCSGFAIGSAAACCAVDAYLSGDMAKLNRYIWPAIKPIF